MSRYYELRVRVSDVSTDAVADAIIEACNEEWGFGYDEIDYYKSEKVVEGCSRGNLCGGEGEKEFADRLATAIMQKTYDPILITIELTYLEELPYETYRYSEKDRKKLGCERDLPEPYEDSEPKE